MPSIATQTTTFLAECPRVLENKKVLKPVFFKRMKHIHERALVKGKKDTVKESKNNKEIMTFMKIMTSLAIGDMRVKLKAEKEAVKQAKKVAEKEPNKAEKVAEKEAKKAEKVAEKEAKKAEKVAEKEAKKAEKEAAKESVKEAEKEAKKAAKEAKKAAKGAKKVVKKLQNKEKRFYIDDLADIRPPRGMFVTTDAFGNRFDMHDM